MKKDFSQKNNPKKRKEHHAPEDLDMASYQPFSKDEEEEDFEILDALEHMEQTETLDEEQVAEGDRMIELTLDDDDLFLDEEDVEGDDSGFHFDEQMSAGLEQELLEQSRDFDLDESIEFETGDTEFEEEAYVLDLNQENEPQPFDVSLEAEIDMEDSDLSLPDEDLTFDLNEEEEDVLGFMPHESEMREESGDVDINLEDEQAISQVSAEKSTDVGLEIGLDLEDVTEEAASEEMDFELGQEHERSEHEETYGLEEDFEAESPDEEEKIGDLVDEIDIAEGFADLESDIHLEDEQFSESEFPEMDFESEPDEFAGKPVITVGDDQVVDLGADDLDQEEDFDFSADSWKQDGMDTTKMFEGASEEEVEEPEEAEEEKSLDSEFDFEAGESVSDASQEEEFMTSYDDIDIDLEAEAAKVLEEASEFGQFDLPEELETTEIESEQAFDLDLHEDEESEAESLESLDLAEKPTEISLSQEVSEKPSEEEMFEEDETRFVSEIASESEAEPEPEDIQEPTGTETETAEFLEVSLRLTPSQMEDFEGMISEAKTLRKYLDELETHRSDIKEKIYQKLRDEYIARQKDIFRAPEFTTLFTDVKEDLQEMLTKHSDFGSTVERLNEELEEITVRHLVGEYDEATLHEKESSQKAEISRWNRKTEKIHQVITRYQDILDAEEALNPLRQEAGAEEDVIPSPLPSEQPEISPEEEFWGDEPVEDDSLQEDEQIIEEESWSDEMPELEETDEEVFGIPGEDQLADDFDFEALSKVAEEFVDETSEEEEEEEEEEHEEFEEETSQEDMISCKKCGRQTPASDKFCIHCGAKAR